MSKEIYVPVDGIARKVTKVYAPVNGVARSVKKVYKGVNGIARQVFEAGKSLETFAVGDSVFLNINNKPIEFLIVHRGLPSAMYDSSCDGIWLLMKDVYSIRNWHKNQLNDYKKADIHAYLNGTFLGLFDASVQAIIKQAKIPYINGTGSSGSVASKANGLPAKIFLPSAHEVDWTAEGIFLPNDGAGWDYFKDASDDDRRAYLNGKSEEEADWWTRSPDVYSTTTVFAIAYGGYLVRPTTDTDYGVRPALILPYNAKVDEATNTIK